MDETQTKTQPLHTRRIAKSKALTAAALLIAVVALIREPTGAQQDAATPMRQWEFATVISNDDPKQDLTVLGHQGFDLVEVRTFEDNSHSRRSNKLVCILNRTHR